jgi:Dolichyl-phosphate-mannose-protein mannosyltransferase
VHLPTWLIDPRRQRFWQLAFGLGLAFRVYAVLVLRNPMDAIFSDPGRHWDNALHFATPTVQGASNPYLYQLYLFLVQKATHQDKVEIGNITAALSVSYALVWYLFARSVFRRRINALRFATALCWMPSHISLYSFFMNETLVLPLVGLAMWFTNRTIDKRSPSSFVATATTWTLAVLTRSVVGPIGLGCVLVSWFKVKRRQWAALAAACAISALWVGAASEHAHRVLKRYTPFGDNMVVAVYFVSAAHDYTMDVKGFGRYIFSSPSLYVSPFAPFYEFPSIREGVVSFSADPDRRGADVERTFLRELQINWRKFPRLIGENVIFFSFGHCWPTAGSMNDRADRICLWERWIWLPLSIVSLVGSLVFVLRRGAAFVPIATLGFLFSFFVIAQVSGFMEGRYRKPLEPMVLLAPIWLWERRGMVDSEDRPNQG